MNPKLDSGFPLEVSPSFWIPCTPIKPGFSGKGRLEKLACVPLACSAFRLANQVSHGQVKAGAGKTLSPCAQQPKPPRLLSSHWHNKCSKIKMFPESGFHTVSLGSPKHPPTLISASSLASSLSPTVQWFSLWTAHRPLHSRLGLTFAPAMLCLCEYPGESPCLFQPQH